jgi:hypothetical protein
MGGFEFLEKDGGLSLSFHGGCGGCCRVCGIYGCGVVEEKGKEYEQKKKKKKKKKKSPIVFDVNNKLAKVEKVSVLVINSLKLPRG